MATEIANKGVAILSKQALGEELESIEPYAPLA